MDEGYRAPCVSFLSNPTAKYQEHCTPVVQHFHPDQLSFLSPSSSAPCRQLEPHRPLQPMDRLVVPDLEVILRNQIHLLLDLLRLLIMAYLTITEMRCDHQSIVIIPSFQHCIDAAWTTLKVIRLRFPPCQAYARNSQAGTHA